MEESGGSKTELPPPLHTFTEKSKAKFNMAVATIQSIAVLFLFRYRLSWFFQEGPTSSFAMILSWTLISVSELIFAFIWMLGQAGRLRPLHRDVFPERLNQRLKEEDLPAIDVFVCMADPELEPLVAVMNTVISAMCLDYPSEKLNLYLSDDAGSPLTLYALHEASAFAKSWLPFCKKYEIETRCPDLYFAEFGSTRNNKYNEKFIAERESMKLMYNIFHEKVMKAKETGIFPGHNGGAHSTQDKQDHPSAVKVILEKQGKSNKDGIKMPSLVYVSREKRLQHPHHFKAGALNVLLRVSAIMSNSPYILVLDCDMHVNDPTAARQAMCFFIDPEASKPLAFVQFPQRFRGVSKNDLYSGQLTVFFEVMSGYDGLGCPFLIGTGFFIDRGAIYGWTPYEDVHDFQKAFLEFGSSSSLIASICGKKPEFVNALANEHELTFLAGCNYEKGTTWGTERGFLYQSVLEDYFTGFRLHCRGWKSVFFSPSKPAFLGTLPNNLHVVLIQCTRWFSGLLEVALSKYCPLTYGMGRISLLQNMCYGFLAFVPLYSFATICYGIIPQLCLLNGVSLFPEVFSLDFATFTFLFLSSYTMNFCEVTCSGESFRTWWNEHRMWMMKGVTTIFSSIQVMLKMVGITDVPFALTSKVEDEEKNDMYQKEVLYFGDESPLFIPAASIAIINLVSLVGGVARLVMKTECAGLPAQLLLSALIVITSCGVYEAMGYRQDNGRLPTSITKVSIAISFVTIAVGTICFHV